MFCSRAGGRKWKLCILMHISRSFFTHSFKSFIYSDGYSLTGFSHERPLSFGGKVKFGQKIEDGENSEQVTLTRRSPAMWSAWKTSSECKWESILHCSKLKSELWPFPSLENHCCLLSLPSFAFSSRKYYLYLNFISISYTLFRSAHLIKALRHKIRANNCSLASQVWKTSVFRS